MRERRIGGGVMGLLNIAWKVAVIATLLYISWGVWHTKLLDVVKPRPLRRTWTSQDQAEFDALVGQPPGGGA